jgi:hypothetical protein
MPLIESREALKDQTLHDSEKKMETLGDLPGLMQACGIKFDEVINIYIYGSRFVSEGF